MIFLIRSRYAYDTASLITEKYITNLNLMLHLVMLYGGILTLYDNVIEYYVTK